MCKGDNIDHGWGGRRNTYRWYAIDEDKHDENVEKNSKWHNWFKEVAIMCGKKLGGREEDDPMHDRLRHEGRAIREQIAIREQKGKKKEGGGGTGIFSWFVRWAIS